MVMMTTNSIAVVAAAFVSSLVPQLLLLQLGAVVVGVEASSYRDLTARSYLCDSNLNEIESPPPMSSWDPSKFVRVCIRRNANIDVDIFIQQLTTYTFTKQETRPNGEKYKINQVVVENGLPVDDFDDELAGTNRTSAASALTTTTKLDCSAGAMLCSFETRLRTKFFLSDGKVVGTGTVALQYGQFNHNQHNSDVGGDGINLRRLRSLRRREQSEQPDERQQHERQLSFAGYIDVSLEIETTTDPVGDSLASAFGSGRSATGGQWVDVPLIRTVLILSVVVLTLCFCCCAVASYLNGRRERTRRRHRHDESIDRSSLQSTESRTIVVVKKKKNQTKMQDETHKTSSVVVDDDGDDDDVSETLPPDDGSGCSSLGKSTQVKRASLGSDSQHSHRPKKSPKQLVVRKATLGPDSNHSTKSPRQLRKTSLGPDSHHSTKSPRQLRKTSLGPDSHHSTKSPRQLRKTSLGPDSNHSTKSPRQLRKASLGPDSHHSSKRKERMTSLGSNDTSNHSQKPQQQKQQQQQNTKTAIKNDNDDTIINGERNPSTPRTIKKEPTRVSRTPRTLDLSHVI